MPRVAGRKVPKQHFLHPLQILNENGENRFPVRENENFVPVFWGTNVISVVQVRAPGFTTDSWNVHSWIFGNPFVYVIFFTDTVSLITTLPDILVLLDTRDPPRNSAATGDARTSPHSITQTAAIDSL